MLDTEPFDESTGPMEPIPDEVLEVCCDGIEADLRREAMLAKHHATVLAAIRGSMR